MEIIDGKKLAVKIQKELKEELENFGKSVGLLMILLGDNPASQIYLRNKERVAKEIGIYSQQIKLPEETTEEELLDLIEKSNQDKKIQGILVQLPLPSHISEEKVLSAISPKKDVDGFHPINMGKLWSGKASMLPSTPAGVIEMLKAYQVEISGKRAVVIGRSNIVGKPMAQLLMMENATVTLAHSYTKNLTELAREADILVVAIGQAKLVTADFIKEGAVVIDVGMNRDENGKLCGDVDFDSVSKKVSFITPVPGGVGPMTITMLMKQTIQAAKESED
ncbi:MAG: bifunctional methylenetetrahydrofolate dehydrogenase/methenyltetrahydrofolate cyclohydrolase [Lactovum sp.]